MSKPCRDFCQCPVGYSVELDRGNNTTCTINLHGATVISWKVKDQEQLFVSGEAVFDKIKAIRGGVPVVFPQFGQWEFGPQHGFARITKWVIEKDPETLASGDIQVILALMDTEHTRSMWNFKFKVTYTLILGEESLNFKVVVNNPSIKKPFSFTILLHTYLRVHDVRQCYISGLKDCNYVDKANDDRRNQEIDDIIPIHEFIDRIYLKTAPEHILHNPLGRNIRIQKNNFPDTVLWNPWIEKAKEINDMGDDEYINMICIEAGHVSTPVVLNPGDSFEAGQVLEIK